MPSDDTVQKVRWWKNGDHPGDDVWRPFEDTGSVPTKPREGAVVRYFRHPGIDGESLCRCCGHRFNDHGWIDTGAPGITICPGTWIPVDLSWINKFQKETEVKP